MDRAISLEARRIDLALEPPFELGSARVDPAAHEYQVGRTSSRIQPQTLKVLVALHDKLDQVVTRDELVDRCWDGRIVGDDVINRCISLLRRLAETSGGFAIETVPRGGYRLVEAPARTGSNRRRWLIGASAATLIAVAAIGLIPQFERQAAPPPALTIALLPFAADASDAETAKLASAARAAVADKLAQGEYAVSTLDAPPVGSGAPADFLISAQVTGTLEKIVAIVRMEEAAHHIVVFSHQFETSRGSADDFPELVAGQVASQVSWTAPLLVIERRHPSDPTIIASLLQATSAGLGSGGDLHDFETSRALAAKDPNSPLAQTNLAFNTAFALDEIPGDERAQAIAGARTAADRALSLAPEFGDNCVPWCLLHSEQRRIDCEKRLRAGMRADPDSPFASWFLAKLILNPVGRDREALELARAARAHDPYMPAKIGLMLRLLEATDHTQEASELYRDSAVWWPKNGGIDWYRASGMVERGDFAALQRFTLATHGHSTAVLQAINRKSLPAVRSACRHATDFDSIVCMLALARSGDLDAAFALADRLYPPRSAPTPADEERIWLNEPEARPVMFLTGNAAAALRRDQRYTALARRVGLLDYWRKGHLPDFCTASQEPICAMISPPLRSP